MKKQVYKLGLVAILGLGVLVNAQVGINEESPKATLDVTAKTTSGDALEGILVPRVTTQKAEEMGTNTQIQESTLIYIKDDATASTQKHTAEVKGKGFYYFADGKWQKVGGSKGATLNAITGKYEVVSHITRDKWTADAFGFVQTGNDAIQLPDPANYIGKIISVNNQYTNTVNYDPTNQPLNMAVIYSGNGHILTAVMKDKKAIWIVIAGA